MSQENAVMGAEERDCPKEGCGSLPSIPNSSTNERLKV